MHYLNTSFFPPTGVFTGIQLRSFQALLGHLVRLLDLRGALSAQVHRAFR